MSDLLVAKRRSWRRTVALVAVVLAPLLLFIALSWHEAVRRQQRDAVLAAASIEAQVAVIMSDAREAVRDLAPLAGRPCSALIPELMRRTALVPYVRSLNVIDGQYVSCSSALGAPASPLAKFPGMPQRAPAGPWASLIASTPMVANRPALLIGEPAPGGRGVFAVVDDRYLRDMLRAITPPGVFGRVELRIGDGTTLVEGAEGAKGAAPAIGTAGGATVAAPAARRAPLVDTRFDVSGTPVSLRVYGLPSRLAATWVELLEQSMPVALALAALFGWLAYRRELSRGSLREQLLEAIRTDQFHVVYQPLYGVADRRCRGVEALLRWDRPGQGPISPEVFIQAAEEEHVVVPLTLHLLKLIAADVRTWNTPPDFHLGINFAAEHLSDEHFLAGVSPCFAELKAHRCEVVLEITERSLMKNNQQARRNLDTLRAEGAKVAIDDFGTGYCSLSYLEKFPFDILKVDHGFVMTIDPEHGDAIVLDAIIALAHRLKAEVVAEGVDQPAQFDYLLTRGVAFMQGYLYARPMTSEAFVEWYARVGEQPVEGGAARRLSGVTTGQG